MSILIGLHIKRTLERDAMVKKYIGTRVFPLAMAQGVETFPFVCYDTNGQAAQTTKDGPVNDVSSVSMAVISKGYEEALNIAEAVRKAFENKREDYPEYLVECVGVTYNDEYVDALDAFAVNLQFDFKTYNK
jgi:hypothetical protein